MRKGIKILLSIGFFLFVMPMASIVSAQDNKIKAIDIRVELHEDGSATIRESRQMEVYEDTEIYIVLDDLNETELLDFEVAGFEEETDWDIDASFEEKANKYGVIDTDEGYELAWGISEYGDDQEYNVTYTLSNLVRELEDGQALFWNFDSFLSVPTDRMNIEISAPFDIGLEIEQFYSFGFEGPFDITDGVFHWTGYGLDDSNDVIVLLQFPPNVFQASADVEMTLVEQRDMALEGSSFNAPEPLPTFVKVILGGLAALGFGSAATGVAYVARRSKVRKENNHFNPSELIKGNNKRVSRTPPQLESDIGNYAALISKIAQSGGGFSEYFFAYLLGWSASEKIHIDVREEDRMLFGSETKARISIANFDEEYEMNRLAFDEYVELFGIGESTFEEVIWGMLLEVADADGIIEGEDIQEWSKDNVEAVASLVGSLDTVSKDWLHENGYIKLFSVKDWGFPVKIEQLTDKGERMALDIIQFDAFIKNIDEVSLDEYKDWQDLIIWAAVLGHAEDTIDYLEEFEPGTWAYLEETYPYIYGNYYGYHFLYMNSSNGLSSGGYSSTGGGFSSTGGGMGAGGGGGGGTR